MKQSIAENDRTDYEAIHDDFMKNTTVRFFNFCVYNAIDEERWDITQSIIENCKFKFTSNHIYYAMTESKFEFIRILMSNGYPIKAILKILDNEDYRIKHFQEAIDERAKYAEIDRLNASTEIVD